MGLTVGTAALAVALARASLIGRLRRWGPVFTRAGGALLATAGAYVAYYGWYEIRALRGDAAGDPVVDVVGAVQRWLAGGLDRLGPARLATAFVTLLIAAVAVGWVRRRRTRRSAEPTALISSMDALS
jgi:hypothetical protein